MGIGTGLAVASIGGGIASSAIGAHAAGKAGDTGAAAADKSAQLQKQAADEALAFNKQQYEENVQRQQPWLTSGTQAVNQLSQLPAFQAPGADFTTDPGYQFRVSEGNKAIERSAAARGAVANPATQKALDRFNQDTASQEYGNIYARRFNEYNSTLSQLQSRAGIGQTTATNLGTAGANAADNSGNIVTTSATRQGADVQNAGAARASGYVGGSNAITSGISQGFGNVNQIYTLSQLLKQQKALKPTSGTLNDTSIGASPIFG